MTLMNRRLAPVLILTAALSAAVGCSANGKADTEDDKEEVAVPVEVATLVRGAIQAAYQGTATLSAEEAADVITRVSGIVETIAVEEGDHVSAGQELARLEDERLRLDVARARAQWQQADQEFKRQERVYEQRLVSREAYDRTRFERDAAKAALDMAQVNLRDAVIRAPIEGVVTARMIKRGNLVQPNTTVFHIKQLRQLQAEVHVPEREIAKLAPGQSARLIVDAWPGREFVGSVERISPVVDAGSGTVKLTLVFADQPELTPGMFGRVRITYDEHADAVLLPKDAVLVEDAESSVFVIREGKAARQRVVTGYSSGDWYEALEGLDAGDQVVVTGQSSLRDGAKVQVLTDAS